MNDYYQILGVPKTASREEIQRAFRRLAREHHPDMSGQATSDEFRRIREAYEVLSDPQRRADYDARRDQGIRIQVQRRPTRTATARWNDVYEIRRASGYAGVREIFSTGGMGSRPGGYDPFEELDRLILAWLRRWTR